MEAFEILEANRVEGAKILCVGVGGAGCNVIAHIANKAMSEVNLIAINTDSESLEQIDGVTKILIGSKPLKGFDARMKPDLGKKAAMENYDEIKNALQGADIVFILVGLGGGTGSGASPIIAQIAKEIGALTIPIATMPFKFEGRQRLNIAECSLEEIKQKSDSVVVIQNQNYISSIDKNLGLKDTFKVIDVVMEDAINGIIGVVVSKGDNDINLDFLDLQTVMSHRGMALVGIGKDEGENAANEAIKQSIEYALLDDISLNEATGILIHFHVHTDFPYMKIADAMEIIHENTHPDAEVIYGVTTDTSLNEEYMKATMILTGFEKIYNDPYDFVPDLVPPPPGSRLPDYMTTTNRCKNLKDREIPAHMIPRKPLNNSDYKI